MVQYGTWYPYTGVNALALAFELVVASFILGFLGFRLRQPIEVRRTGLFAGITLGLLWLLSWATFVESSVTYFEALVRDVGVFRPPSSPISRFTFSFALIGFIAIIVMRRKSGWLTAIGSAMAAMMAAPMIFELPFDLIIVGHLYPTPPPPVLRFTLLYFLPLFLIGISSFGLLTVSPLLRLSRYTLFCLAGMFLVFAIWALLGFSYPAPPITLWLNVLAKLLAFGAAVILFIP